MPELDFHVYMESPSGTMDLDDGVTYDTEAGSLNERAVTWRKRSISAEWVEGTFDVAAVKENVTETVRTYVTADDPVALDFAVTRLTDGYSELRYDMRLTWGGYQEVWRCMPAAYSISSTGPLMFATKALVSAQVPRLPTVIKLTP